MALLVGDKTPFDFEYRNPYDQLKTSDTGRGVAIKKDPVLVYAFVSERYGKNLSTAG